MYLRPINGNGTVIKILIIQKTLSLMMMMIASRSKGIIQFTGEDKDAHTVPLQDITVIPQQENQRGGHK